MYLGYTKHRTPQLGFNFSTVVWILYKPLKTFVVYFLVVLLHSIKVQGAFMKSKGSQAWPSHFPNCVTLFYFSRGNWWVPARYQLGIMEKKKLKKNFIGFYTM
jgi:hypothetical protein